MKKINETRSTAIEPGKLYLKALRLARTKKPKWDEVLTLLESASAGGSPAATYALATWYLFGKEPIIRKNQRQAVRMLRESANAGYAPALYDLAVCYQNGEGVRKSDFKALSLYLASALRGDVGAIVEMARCYEYGYGTKPDKKLAKVFSERAIELGVTPHEDGSVLD